MGRTKLDYSYGSEDKVEDKDTGVVGDDSLFVVKDRKGNTVTIKNNVPKKAKLPDDVKTHKYLHYEEYVQPEEFEENGYKYDKDDDFKKLDIKGWNTFVGFMAIRIVSPLLLLVQAIASGVYVWMCGFDFSPEGPLARGPYGGVGTMIILSLSIHAFLVHALNKWLFSRTYWKKRSDYEEEKRNSVNVAFEEPVTKTDQTE